MEGFIGMVCGVLVGVMIAGGVDSRVAERGFVTIGGQLYVLRPATAEERP